MGKQAGSRGTGGVGGGWWMGVWVGVDQSPHYERRRPAASQTALTVVLGGILQRQPDAHAGGRFGGQEGAVLVRHDLAPHKRLLADQHRLRGKRSGGQGGDAGWWLGEVGEEEGESKPSAQAWERRRRRHLHGQRRPEAQRCGQLRHFLAAAPLAEHRVQVVQGCRGEGIWDGVGLAGQDCQPAPDRAEQGRSVPCCRPSGPGAAPRRTVPDLVDGAVQGLGELAVGPHRLLLEEARDARGRVEEVAVRLLGLVARGEHGGDARGVEARHLCAGGGSKRLEACWGQAGSGQAAGRREP